MMENDKIIVVVFLDFKRAFAPIDRDLLLWKLEKYVVKGVELERFRGYLSNRSQETRFYESISQASFSLGFPKDRF
jgi:hypothetical protein